MILFTQPKDEIHDGSSDKEDQRWNNSSDDGDDDDGNGAEYSWQGVNEKSTSKQTKGKLLIIGYLVSTNLLVNKKLINK